MSFRGAPTPHETDREIFFAASREPARRKPEQGTAGTAETPGTRKRYRYLFVCPWCLCCPCCPCSAFPSGRLLSPEVRLQAEVGRQSAEEPADLIRVQAGLGQTAMDLRQAPVPDRVQ